MQNLRKVQLYTQTLQKSLPRNFMPKVGIVLGTGLGTLAGFLTDTTTVPYTVFSDFPESTVQSHKGCFVAGYLAGIPLILQQGRCHLYEGKTPAEVCSGVRVMASLGITTLILTNAAGAINPLFDAGSLMIITDHVNTTGQSPLTGGNADEWGPRFPDMSALYDERLATILGKTALALGIRVEQGVYVCVPGPQLETRAETRAYRALGGDAVGMSTALEAIAAHHMGVRILGISCLTNKNLPDCMEKATLTDIIAASENAAEGLSTLLRNALPELVRE